MQKPQQHSTPTLPALLRSGWGMNKKWMMFIWNWLVCTARSGWVGLISPFHMNMGGLEDLAAWFHVNTSVLRTRLPHFMWSWTWVSWTWSAGLPQFHVNVSGLMDFVTSFHVNMSGLEGLRIPFHVSMSGLEDLITPLHVNMGGLGWFGGLDSPHRMWT